MRKVDIQNQSYALMLLWSKCNPILFAMFKGTQATLFLLIPSISDETLISRCVQTCMLGAIQHTLDVLHPYSQNESPAKDPLPFLSYFPALKSNTFCQGITQLEVLNYCPSKWWWLVMVIWELGHMVAWCLIFFDFLIFCPNSLTKPLKIFS